MRRLVCVLVGHLWLVVVCRDADRGVARCDRCGAYRVTA